MMRHAPARDKPFRFIAGGVLAGVALCGLAALLIAWTPS